MKTNVKALSLLLALAFLFSFATPLTVGAKEEYVDVDAGRWSRNAVLYVSEKGYMQGVGGGRFDPAGPMTRAMVVTVLWRIEGKPEAGKSSFSDVPAGKWYSEAVAWAETTGVVTGVGGGKFNPDGKITREQLATILYRYCSYKKLDVTEKGDVSVFKDKNKIDSWAADAVAWAVGIGLINGVTAETVNPLGKATREQVATILERFDTNKPGKLVDLFAPVVEQIADYAEKMLDEVIEKRATDPNYDLIMSQPGTLLIGLAEAGRWDYIQRVIDDWIENGTVRTTGESGLLGYVLVGLYERTKDEKYLPVIEKLKKETDEWPADEYGELYYGTHENDDGGEVYVDGTGMFTPFLARYAAVFGDEATAANARLQVVNYYKYGVNRITQMAYHGYSEGNKFEGDPGWGRGTGWFMFAVGPVLRYCPDEDTAERSEKFISKTMNYRLENGLFPWSLSSLGDNQSDSSATGMIMWGVLKAKENGFFGSVSLDEILRTAKASLCYVKEGGVVDGASGASGGWYVYSSVYENNGWGQGGMLAFLAALINYLNS